MASISSLSSDKLRELLGGVDSQIMDGETGTFAITPNEKTLFIGVGGNGCTTVDYVCGELYKKFSAIHVNQQVRFLAIDTTEKELKSLQNLGDSEVFHLKPVTEEEDWRKPDSRDDKRPEYIKEFLPDKLAGTIRISDPDGAGQYRIVGKTRLYEYQPTSSSIHDKLIFSIREKYNQLDVAQGQKFRVIFILGLAGGTGSGAVCDIAGITISAIKRSMSTYDRLGFFFMPDTCIENNSEAPESLKYNGYAALKELEHYMSSAMDIQTQMRVKDDLHKFSNISHLPYTSVYLVSKAGAGANDIARFTIADAVVDLMANLQTYDANGNLVTFDTSSNVSNFSTHRGVVIANSAVSSEDSHMYGAIGYAYAGVRKDAVKSFIYNKLLDNLMPVGVTDAIDESFVTVPYNETRANAKIEGDLRLLNIVSVNATINSEVNKCTKTTEITGKAIPNSVNTEVAQRLVNCRRGMDALEKYAKDQYNTLKQNVIRMLSNEGPYALAAMYEGKQRTTDGAPSTYGTGIRARLLELSGYFGEDSINDCVKKAEKEQKKIGSLKRFLNVPCTDWQKAINALAKEYAREELNKCIYNKMDGNKKTAGFLESYYIAPAIKLFEQIIAFTKVLDAMKDIYQANGKRMESLHEYARDLDGEREVCIDNTVSAYERIKNEALQIIDGTSLTGMKTNFVKSFTDSPETWTETDAADNLTLRKAFDSCIPTIDLGTSFSIENSFVDARNNGNLPEFVNSLVANVKNKAEVLFDSNSFMGAAMTRNVLTLPESLYNRLDEGDGNNPLNSILDGMQNTTWVISSTADKISYYALRAPMPLRAYNNLEDLRNAYERHIDRAGLHTNESNKGSFNNETGLPWIDRPCLVVEDRPEIQTYSNGEPTREAKKRIKLRKFAETCIKYDLLTERKDGDLYYYEAKLPSKLKNADFDSSKFDITGYDSYAQLMDAFAQATKDHTGELQAIAKMPVTTSSARQASGKSADRAKAKSNMLCVLRKNVSLYIDLKTSLEKMLPLFKKLETRISENKYNDILSRALISCQLMESAGDCWMFSAFPDVGVICNLTNLSISKKHAVNTLEYKLATLTENSIKYYLMPDSLSQLDENQINVIQETYANWQNVVESYTETGKVEELTKLNTAGKKNVEKILAELKQYHDTYLDTRNPICNVNRMNLAGTLGIGNDPTAAIELEKINNKIKIFYNTISSYLRILG